MKRTFDNTVMGGQSTAGQISTGVTATKDIVYMNTNMVNIQEEDNTSAHGIAATFNQTRVLPIVGRTNRAEIAIKSVDIQTKTLPIFQPQVQLGTDVNRLIYEVGLSATWRNGLLELPPDGVRLNTLATPVNDPQIQEDPNNSYYQESTFLNVSGAESQFIDSYNMTTPLKLLNTNLTNTALSVLFDAWNNQISIGGSSVINTGTCLTPVVVPSVAQHIIDTSYVISGQNIGKYAFQVASTNGYKVGDRVRLFGLVDYLDPNNLRDTMEYPYATVLDVITFDTEPSATANGVHPSLILDYPVEDYTGLTYLVIDMMTTGLVTIQIPLVGVQPAQFQIGQMVWIRAVDPNAQIDYRLQNQFLEVIEVGVQSINVQILVTGNQGINTPSSPITLKVGNIRQFKTGYIINECVKSGGHIEFLTNEYEFRPQKFIGTDQNNGVWTNMLMLQFDTTASPPPQIEYNRGFWRGYYASGQVDTSLFPVPIQITCTNGTVQDQRLYNGVYTCVQRVNQLYILAPLSKALPVGSFNTTGLNFTMTLAPNFYALDTSADAIIDPLTSPTTTSNKYNLLRSLGYLPTPNIIVQPATYPPTASVPSQTWTRAYTVNWDFSAYRNVEWVPQDTTAIVPGQPNLQQDFGSDSGSTYYNVYEFNKFLDDCVNRALSKCINDQSYDVLNLGALSLNFQLATAFEAYIQLLDRPASNFLYNSAVTYAFGSMVVTGTLSSSFVFLSTKNGNTQALPVTATSSTSWMFLGYVPYQTGDPTPYALCIKETTGNTQAGPSLVTMSATVEIGVPSRLYQTNILYTLFQQVYLSNPPITTTITLPTFKTIAPQFHYDNLTLLSHVRYDGTGFGTLNVPQSGLTQSQIALYNYKRRTWGHQGSQNADEWFLLESNTSFKFLLDNFPSYCIAYADTLSELRGTGKNSFPQIEYWLWDNSSITVDPRTGTGYYEISQTSESLSSCMSPVQSIVVVSENIPVVDELSSPLYYLIDSDSSTFANNAQTIALTEKIIGEIFLPTNTPFNGRSVIHYEEDNFKFVSLLDTRLFKQLEYSLYYRHRITQNLVPLILSNYGSVNIKFVFRPIS
jgi:hypothetical protein